MVAVHLAYFNFGAFLRVFYCKPTQRNIFPQYGRAGGTRYFSYLLAADVDAIAMGAGLFSCKFQPNKFFLWVCFSIDQRLAAYEVIFLCL